MPEWAVYYGHINSMWGRLKYKGMLVWSLGEWGKPSFKLSKRFGSIQGTLSVKHSKLQRLL